jgi:hypothetical protein
LWLACTRFFYAWQMSYKCTGNSRDISTLFKTYFLHFGSRCLTGNKSSDKMSVICIHFYRLIDCGMSDQIFYFGSKMFNSKQFDCILPVEKRLFCRTIVWQEFEFFTGILKNIFCNSMEKYAFFAEQLLDSNLNFSQALWNFFAVH